MEQILHQLSTSDIGLLILAAVLAIYAVFAPLLKRSRKPRVSYRPRLVVDPFDLAEYKRKLGELRHDFDEGYIAVERYEYEKALLKSNLRSKSQPTDQTPRKTGVGRQPPVRSARA